MFGFLRSITIPRTTPLFLGRWDYDYRVDVMDWNLGDKDCEAVADDGVNLRLWTRLANRVLSGRHVSYQRAKRNTNPSTSLLQLEGVGSTEAAKFYLGKRVAFVYRAHKEIRGSKIRVIWGKVTRT